MKRRIIDILLVTLGSFIAAVGYNSLLVKNNIASGGVGGLAISLNALFGWNNANFVLATTIPLLILCWCFLGREVLLKTFYGSLIFPTFIKLTEGLPTLTKQPLLAAIFGGIVLGLGLGIVFYGNSSTGGTGIITQILNKYTPLPLGMVLLIVDGIIVAISAIAFPPDTVMYSILSLGVVSLTIDKMMVGLNSSRNLLIISQNSEQILNYITRVADRGATKIPILGGHTGHAQNMIMTTLSTREVPKVQGEIQKIDETAFIVIVPASTVMGRGFSLQKDYQRVPNDFINPL